MGLFDVDPTQDGVHRTDAAAMDATRRLAVVRLDRAPGRPIGTIPGSAALAQARPRNRTPATPKNDNQPREAQLRPA